MRDAKDVGDLPTFTVNDVYTTIQGEGCLTGVPMVLVRLHGCPVGCPFCDTKETWDHDPENEVPELADALGTSPRYVRVDVLTLADYIAAQAGWIQWVLLTGGEPALQPLERLVPYLHGRRLKVAIETSGTARGHIDAGIDWVCVSPKVGMPGRRTIIPAAIAVADELKFVGGRDRDIDAVDDFLKTYPTKRGVTVCLQPVSQSPRATDLCMTTCLARGWRLSIQVHKYVGQR